MSFKPMLAPGEDPSSFPDYFKKIRYPLLGSPKYDGIRCIIKSGRALSRTGKMLPSLQVQEEFTSIEHLDGELVCGNPTAHDCYNKTQSHVMSEDKPGDITYYVFDYCHPAWLDKPFYQRLEKAEKLIKGKDNYKIVDHFHVEDYYDLIQFEERCLEQEFEGIMLRDPIGIYKQGRGTFKEGLIYKLKRFFDDEAEIIGFKEQMENNNPLERDELGFAKRSTAKEGMIPANTLGGFIGIFNEMEIDIAPGAINHEERKHIWNHREHFRGKYLKFRYFKYGIKEKPRFPRAIGFRDTIDIGE